ncbi:major capsid protein [Clostridium sp. UBA1652]|uniref:major capsid protein n=1 Tax=Clostridium sp. UBA1652 TaxID=1946348 RepID=UPI00258103BD|nr:phage capsid protein [Clostridium sp. UBA1652]
MAITLQQAKVGMANKVDQMVVDEFRRGSILMDKITFDDTVSPGTGGSTLVYGYTQLKTPATAGFRDINTEYTPQVADRQTKSVELKVFGGTFDIDRVLANTSGSINEVDFQLKEKVKATINLFHNAVINGDKSVKGFDGLDKMLVGSSTEINTGSVIDLSNSAAVDANYKTLLDLLDEFLAEMDGVPDALMGNSKLITRIKQAARRAGYLTHSEDAFGRSVESYNGIPLVDLQYYYDGTTTKPTVPIVTRTVGTSTTGLTDLYGARFAIDGLHAASPAGGKLINTWLPDFKTAGAVKKGEVEMVAATVLKKSRAAGVLRNIKVQ